MQLTTLGPLRLAGTNLTRPKPLLLLAYLALEGAKPRRHLAEVFFNDARDAADALSSTLRRLRGAGDVIALDGRMVTCTVPCDAAHVLELLDAGAVDDAAQMVAGPFLADLTVPLGAELEEWVFAMREHIGRRVRSGLVIAAERAWSNGDASRARTRAERAAFVPGADELEAEEAGRLHRVLRTIGSSKAEQVREQARAAGVTLPDQPVMDTSFTPAAGGKLPKPLTELVGRDPELLELAKVLDRSDVRLLTLHGPAGVGKTRLAVAAAHEQHDLGAFPDGVSFVELDGLTRAELVPGAIAAALGVPPLRSVDAWAELAHRIGGDRRLVVLDNLEHLLGAAAHLPPLLAACDGLKLLVTSRERLNVGPEWVFSIDGLAIPHDTQPFDEAMRVDALHLFVQRAQRGNMAFHTDASELPDACAICREVGGLPLGLELAAAWTRVLPLAKIAEALRSDVTAVATERRDVGPRHRSLRAALQHSWSLRSAAERAMLRRLSVFQGGFRREAARRVARANVADLARLVDASLLRMHPNGRFDQHALVHQFSSARAEEWPDERATSREEHGRFVVDLLHRARERSGADPKAVFALLEEEEEANVLACLDWAVQERRTEVLLALSEPLLWYYPMRGRFPEGAALFERATRRLDETDPGSHEVLASLLVGRAFFARYAGSIEESKEHATRAARLARACGSSLERTRALHMLGQVVMFEGHYAKATEMLTEAARLTDELGEPVRHYRILCDLVNAASLLGAYGRATDHADAALSLEGEAGGALGFDAVALRLSIGVLQVCRGDWRAAERILQEALNLASEVGYQGPVPVVRALLAQALLASFSECGDATLLMRARREVDRGMNAARLSQEGMGLSMLHGAASALATHDERASEALANARHAVRIAWQNRNLTILFWAFPRLIEACIEAGRPSDAALAVSLVRHHHAAPRWTQLRASEASARLAATDDSPEAHRAHATGGGLELDQVLENLVGGAEARH